MIFFMFPLISKICWSFKNTVFLQEFDDFHIIYLCINRCIYHSKTCFFITCFISFFVYNLSFFRHRLQHRKFMHFSLEFGPKTAPKWDQKSLRFQCLSPGGHFGTPWLFWGSIFARLGALSGLIMAAGGPKRLQKETKKFPKIIKITLFVARW